MSKELCPDIAVIGSGVGGLMTAARLSAKGYRVAVVEKAMTLSAGPSVRNEGWLHAGTYHSTSIKDPQKAVEVAQRCQYGHRVIRELAPEAIEEADFSYAVLGQPEYADYARERWDAAEVWYQSILLRELAEACPEVDTTRISKAFQVKDVSINTPALYQNLVQRIQEAGGEFWMQSTLRVDDLNQAWIEYLPTGEHIPLSTQLIINTTGYGMAEYLTQFFGEAHSMRFWKSHLIVYHRLGNHNVFYLEPGEAAAFQHGKYTIVGQHEDATIQPFPNYDVLPEQALGVRQATERLYPEAARTLYMETACLKPDLSRGAHEPRSLGVEVYEPMPGFIFALPGKMTESPYVADQLVQLAEEQNVQRSRVLGGMRTTIPITPRPCDTWTEPEATEAA